jgi:hypothetical protein
VRQDKCGEARTSDLFEALTVELANVSVLLLEFPDAARQGI